MTKTNTNTNYNTALPSFVNRSRDDFHLNVLSSLEENGPAPATVLSYRAEMNDSQLQHVLDFLEERDMIVRTPLSAMTRNKLDTKFSMSAKLVVSITDRGRKYLKMLIRLDNEIDWTLKGDVPSDIGYRGKRRD